MKKGINIWAYGDTPVEECLRAAKKTGFDGIELSYALTGKISPDATVAEMKALAAQAADIGIAISSLASGIFWQFNMASDDAAERAAAARHLHKMIELAAALGAPDILVIPGFMGPFQAGAPVVADYEAAYQRATEVLRKAAPRAEDLGVNMDIENVWNKFLGSPLEMRAFIDGIGSSRARAYFDVGNVMRTGYPEHWIGVLGARIACVHFKDYRVNVGTLDGFVELLQGDVDYPAVMAALRRIGYDGYTIAEVFPTKIAPHAVPVRAKEAMDLIYQM